MSASRFVFFLVLLCGSLGQVTIAADPPNIVFMMADDLGYGDLGCYGQKKIPTPHIDQLARQGTRFTDFYAGSTVCAPSRCVLMTGLHLGHCFIRGNGKDNLRPDDLTVAEVLQNAGYTCGMFGKWGLGHENSTGLPTRQGFDEFVGYLDQHHAHNYYPTFLIHNGQRLRLPNVVPGEGEYGQGVATRKKQYSHDVIMDAAWQFLDENHDKRFFLYLPITLPHANNEAKKAGMEIPDYGPFANRDWPDPSKGFAAMVKRIDDNVGRLMQKLRDEGIDDETIVFFTSDNGPHREGGQDPDFFNSNGPLRGIKRDLYEGGIRVPMIVRWPGHVPANATSDHQAYHGDFLATCCDLTNQPVPENLDSISFLPAALGHDDQQKSHEYLYWEFYERGFKQAVRQGKWKYVRIDDTEELYNLDNDLQEAHDVSKDHPDRLQAMRKLARQAHVPSPRWDSTLKRRASRGK